MSSTTPTRARIARTHPLGGWTVHVLMGETVIGWLGRTDSLNEAQAWAVEYESTHPNAQPALVIRDRA